MVEGVGFEIRKVGHAGAGVQIVSSPPMTRLLRKLKGLVFLLNLCYNFFEISSPLLPYLTRTDRFRLEKSERHRMYYWKGDAYEQNLLFCKKNN